jgi:opacity protein-like surface antigen
MYRNILAAGIVIISTCASLAQDTSKQPVYDSTAVFKPMDPWDSSGWVLTVTPYAWAPEIDGKATLSGFTGTVDTSFNHIWNHLDFAGTGRVEAWKGDWSFFVDAIYVKCSDNFALSRGPFSADFSMDVKMAMVDVGASYKLLDIKVGDSGQRVVFTPYAGGRYAYLKQEVGVSPTGPLAPIIGQRTIGGDSDWVEPFVGGRILWRVTERFFTAFRGDVGGFDICDGSKLTWNLVAWLGYQVTNNISLEAGYRILDIDYSTGSGRNEFGINAQLRGPVAGITIRF